MPLHHRLSGVIKIAIFDVKIYRSYDIIRFFIFDRHPDTHLVLPLGQRQLGALKNKLASGRTLGQFLFGVIHVMNKQGLFHWRSDPKTHIDIFLELPTWGKVLKDKSTLVTRLDLAYSLAQRVFQPEIFNSDFAIPNSVLNLSDR